MKFDAHAQRKFFDLSEHQYEPADILNPPRAQQLEYTDMESGISLKKNATILDYGCGSGRSVMYFLKKGYTVTGFDISESPLKALMRLYKKERNRSWGTLTTTTHVPQKQFDAVVGADILHHIPIADHLPVIYHALKPGGVAVFTEPNPLHIPWYFYYVFGGRPLSVEYGILQCSVWNLAYQFKKAGFLNISIKGHGIFPTRIMPQILHLDDLNAHTWANLPFLKLFAFRYIITAYK